jgi:TPR repeat protein
MVNLGNLFDLGHGVEQDYPHANALYREAVKVGNDTDASINASLNLEVSYFEGKGVQKCVATARSFRHRAADLGHAGSQYNVGVAYMKGEGGYDKNIQLARQYIKASASQGNDKAVALLKTWNACAHCGTTPAAKVCKGCITTRYCRYCDAECQLAQWTGPADPHRAHCGGRP